MQGVKGTNNVKRPIVGVTLEREVIEAVDSLRGDIPRSRFIDRVLREKLLDDKIADGEARTSPPAQKTTPHERKSETMVTHD